MNVQFQKEQLRAFELLSHDRNPLHNDPVYSRPTQFGRPIVYGMCGVLLGLGHWAKGRSFQLTKIQGRFVKPLFESVEYELEICETGSEVKVQYLEDGNSLMNFRFTWKGYEGAEGHIVTLKIPPTFHPLTIAADPGLQDVLTNWQQRDCSYSVREESLSQLLPEFCLRPGQMPPDQLNALMGSSYLVGMEVPGRQALYSSFEFEFEANTTKEISGSFQFRNVSAEFDARFNRVSLSGLGSGIRSFSLQAFQRPEHVRYGIGEIHHACNHSDALKDKVIFVSGATRGFGAVLVRMLALQGANIFVNYRSNRDEAEAMAVEIRPWSTKVFPVAGDVSWLEDCRRIGAEINKQFGHVDLIVSNAFPQIPARGFLEQTSSEFMQFLEKSVSTTVTLFRELLPLVAKDGIVMLISTCYTLEPEPRYSHYVAAKACLEGLMRSLAVEFPDQKFVVVRPPRMLTDQTNLVFDLSPPVSAVDVARELMENLSQLNKSSNLTELNLGKN